MNPFDLIDKACCICGPQIGGAVCDACFAKAKAARRAAYGTGNMIFLRQALRAVAGGTVAASTANIAALLDEASLLTGAAYPADRSGCDLAALDMQAHISAMEAGE